MNFSYLFLLLLQRLLLLLLLLVPGWENTMAVKDGEAPLLHPEILKPIENDEILAAFSSCCCYEF